MNHIELMKHKKLKVIFSFLYFFADQFEK